MFEDQVVHLLALAGILVANTISVSTATYFQARIGETSPDFVQQIRRVKPPLIDRHGQVTYGYTFLATRGILIGSFASTLSIMLAMAVAIASQTKLMIIMTPLGVVLGAANLMLSLMFPQFFAANMSQAMYLLGDGDADE